MESIVLHSARKHGVADEDMLHALRHAIRVPRLVDLTVVVGPDRSARLLEVGVVPSEGREFIVHCMPVRPKFLR